MTQRQYIIGRRLNILELGATLDISAIPVIQERPRLPVIIDPSHASGVRQYVAPLGYAAVAAGADGLIVEVHPKPPVARFIDLPPVAGYSKNMMDIGCRPSQPLLQSKMEGHT